MLAIVMLVTYCKHKLKPKHTYRVFSLNNTVLDECDRRCKSKEKPLLVKVLVLSGITICFNVVKAHHKSQLLVSFALIFPSI